MRPLRPVSSATLDEPPRSDMRVSRGFPGRPSASDAARKRRRTSRRTACGSGKSSSSSLTAGLTSSSSSSFFADLRADSDFPAATLAFFADAPRFGSSSSESTMRRALVFLGLASSPESSKSNDSEDQDGFSNCRDGAPAPRHRGLLPADFCAHLEAARFGASASESSSLNPPGDPTGDAARAAALRRCLRGGSASSSSDSKYFDRFAAAVVVVFLWPRARGASRTRMRSIWAAVNLEEPPDSQPTE
mmetsp:Transcript_10723/g.37911  ORF Transcript_10723/g.37911 Transcript_10723/m.37911 type:complete len:247 (+) Transcript_10723:2042-2782(+)